MAKVVFKTVDLQFEVQRWDADQSYNDDVFAISGRWAPVERSSSQKEAEIMAQVLQRRNTLEKYRVVDTFADEEGE